MKIITLCNIVGSGATGMVVNNLISGLLENKTELQIIAKKFRSEYIPEELVSIVPDRKFVHKQSFTYLFYFLTSYSFNELLWIQDAVKKIESLVKRNTKPDFLLIFASAEDIDLLFAGQIAAKRFGIPLYIHATDPIPSIPQWFKYQIIRNSILKTAKKCFKKAALISLTNSAMLEYQLSVSDVESGNFTFVAMNPHRGEPIKRRSADGPFLFLFLGVLSHQRNPKTLIDAFIEYIKIRDDVILQFVGDNQLYQEELSIDANVLARIQFLPWTDHPDVYIEKASVLIDLDAPYENDVFISSKLNKYLNTDVPILSVTPKNSPSETLLKDMINSTVVVNYNSNGFLDAFDKVLRMSLIHSDIIMTERGPIIQSLNYLNITKKMIEKLDEYKKKDMVMQNDHK